MQENDSCTTVLAIQRHLCTCLLSWFGTSLWCQLKIIAIGTLIADFALIVRIPSEYSSGPLRILFIVGYHCATIRITGSPVFFVFLFFLTKNDYIIMGTHAHCLVQIRKKLFEEECIKHFNEPIL